MHLLYEVQVQPLAHILAAENSILLESCLHVLAIRLIVESLKGVHQVRKSCDNSIPSVLVVLWELKPVCYR